ncbi:hypothetical protein RhiirA1_478764 [Rhizophagus irregularis]|uniref:Uncharacterized protein n=1 Tax=Rhizophagus irregularis TaxID=588596 RepID=A0A2N0QRK6_9GLOM|nr:hypothetical protein RhiirA1_478764 [Rhizophagus irregularis]
MSLYHRAKSCALSIRCHSHSTSPNVKDINLAPLTQNLGAKAVNVPLSLNSYKPKRWVYITFNSQETMDAAIEQTVSFQGKVLSWSSPDNTNKLCHRCGNSNANTRSHFRSRSKSRDQSTSISRRGNNISQNNNKNNVNSQANSNPNNSQRARHNSKERSVSFSSSSHSTARPLPR